MQNKLFVQNFDDDVTESELLELFSQHGEVLSCNVPVDPVHGKSRGFAFIEMSTTRSADAAIRALDKRSFAGRTLHVAICESQERPRQSQNR